MKTSLVENSGKKDFSYKELAELHCLKYLWENDTKSAIGCWMGLKPEKKEAQQESVKTLKSIKEEIKLAKSLVNEYKINNKLYLLNVVVNKGLEYLWKIFNRADYYWGYYFCFELLQTKEGEKYLSEIITASIKLKNGSLLYYRLVALISLDKKILPEAHKVNEINKLLYFLLQQAPASQGFLDWLRKQDSCQVSKELNCFLAAYTLLKGTQAINYSLNFEDYPLGHAIFLQKWLSCFASRKKEISLSPGWLRLQEGSFSFRETGIKLAWSNPESAAQLWQKTDIQKPLYQCLMRESSMLFSGIEEQRDTVNLQGLILHDALHPSIEETKTIGSKFWRKKVLHQKSPEKILEVYRNALIILMDPEFIYKLLKLESCSYNHTQKKDLEDYKDFKKLLETSHYSFVDASKSTIGLEFITGISRVKEAKIWVNSWFVYEKEALKDFKLCLALFSIIIYLEGILAFETNSKTTEAEKFFITLPVSTKIQLVTKLVSYVKELPKSALRNISPGFLAKLVRLSSPHVSKQVIQFLLNLARVCDDACLDADFVATIEQTLIESKIDFISANESAGMPLNPETHSNKIAKIVTGLLKSKNISSVFPKSITEPADVGKKFSVPDYKMLSAVMQGCIEPEVSKEVAQHLATKIINLSRQEQLTNNFAKYHCLLIAKVLQSFCSVDYYKKLFEESEMEFKTLSDAKMLESENELGSLLTEIYEYKGNGQLNGSDPIFKSAERLCCKLVYIIEINKDNFIEEMKQEIEPDAEEDFFLKKVFENVGFTFKDINKFPSYKRDLLTMFCFQALRQTTLPKDMDGRSYATRRALSCFLYLQANLQDLKPDNVTSKMKKILFSLGFENVTETNFNFSEFCWVLLDGDKQAVLEKSTTEIRLGKLLEFVKAFTEKPLASIPASSSFLYNLPRQLRNNLPGRNPSFKFF